MFGCIYFEKDASLSVVSEKDPDLNILDEFSTRRSVEMKWRRPGKATEIFTGVIVKVGEKEETLLKFATTASNNLLKDAVPGCPAPEELFSFTTKRVEGKRERVVTKKMKESQCQKEELSSPKKKKKKDLAGTRKQEFGKTETITSPVTTSTVTKQQQDCQRETSMASERLMSGLFSQFLSEDSRTESGPILPQGLPQPPAQAYPMEPSSVMVTPVNVFSPPPRQDDQTFQVLRTQSKQPSSTVTLTDTWDACSSAIDIIENGMPSMQSLPSSSTDHYVKCEVGETLRRLCQPEFTQFLTTLSKHLESDTCRHSCFQFSDEDVIRTRTKTVRKLDISSLSTPTNFTVNQRTVELDEPEVLPKHSDRTVELDEPEVLPKQSERTVKLDEHDVLPKQSEKTADEPKHMAEQVNQRSPVQKVTNVIRRSPRKKSPCSTSKRSDDQVQLLATSAFTVDRNVLRKAQQVARAKASKAGYHLMYQLLTELFSIEELARSRGTGQGKGKPGDDNRPVLDVERINVLKDYVTVWTKRNLEKVFPDSMLNMAITERIGYARKQTKKPKQ